MTKLQLRNCEFSFKCDAQWDEMGKTETENVRFCDACQKEVYRCDTDEELIRAIRSNLCVAIPSPYPREEDEPVRVLAGSMRFRSRNQVEDDPLPTLKYVMSMSEYDWSIWLEKQSLAVVTHLKTLVKDAPPYATRANQITKL
jgi:hypothetical protein